MLEVRRWRYGDVAMAVGLPLLLAAVSALFTFVPWLHAHGLYLRDAVLAADGAPQWWRVLTAMWVHLGWRHWLGDTLAAAGLVWLIGREARPREIMLVLLVCGVAVQLALLAVPAVRWYGGLSGALHGLAAWGALRLLGTARLSTAIGVGLGAGVLIKIWLEQSWLAPIRFDAGWDFGVVAVAHAYGALAGLACWLVQQWWGSRRGG